MGIVIRGAGGQVEDFHSELAAQPCELEGLAQVVFERVVNVHSEGVLIRQAAGKVFRDAGAGLCRRGKRRVGTERDDIECAQAHGQINRVAVGANGRDDLAEDACAVLEGAAVFSRTSAGAQKLVEQIAVAVFDVNKIGADVPGDPGRANVVLNEPFESRRRSTPGPGW